MFATLGLVALMTAPIVITGRADAQGAPTPAAQPAPQTRIYTLNQDALYARSAFGQRVVRETKDRRARLGAENARLQAGLKTEEQDLTDKRPSLSPVEFRKLADAFDAKVQKIRKDQAIKNNALNAWIKSERGRFFKLASPVLLKMAVALDALAILDDRTVIISAEQINLTDRAVARMNGEIGDGTTVQKTPPPAKTPAPATGAKKP